MLIQKYILTFAAIAFSFMLTTASHAADQQKTAIKACKGKRAGSSCVLRIESYNKSGYCVALQQGGELMCLPKEILSPEFDGAQTMKERQEFEHRMENLGR